MPQNRKDIEIEIGATTDIVSFLITHQASNYRVLQSSLTALESRENAAILTDAVRLSLRTIPE